MEHKIETNQYSNVDAFLDDAQLVFDNARIFNGPDTIYHKSAAVLEDYVNEQAALYRVKREES